MSRGIDARLRKIEMSAGGEDEPSECIALQDAARITELRDRWRAVLSSRDASPAEMASARDKLAQLEGLVWERVQTLRDPDAMAALTAEVLEGARPGCTWHWHVDYEMLARSWQLVDANGALGSCPASPTKRRIAFIERCIVCPPRDLEGQTTP